MYINGEFVKEEEAKISVFDLGLIRGYGVFDFLRTYEGRPFHLRDHLLRLQYSAHQVGMQLPSSFEEIESLVAHLLEHNHYPESGIKIIVTGGVSPDQIIPKEPAHLMILDYPLTTPPNTDYTQGIATVTTQVPRSLPLAKTLYYIPAVMALQQGKSKHAKEALYLNSAGDILEATTSNFFGFTQDGTLFTCDSEEILFGITREVILRLAKNLFPIRLEPISALKLDSLVECFITSSSREIMPVVRIDDYIIGEGTVGPRTQKLMGLFASYTQQDKWEDLHISRYEVPCKWDTPLLYGPVQGSTCAQNK
jgi:branched-chain amino acid aminotransferase